MRSEWRGGHSERFFICKGAFIIDIERTHYNRVWRSLVHPYWVFDPMTYRTPMGFGIWHFAEKGEVGTFNLAWLVVPPSANPNDPKTYQNAPLKWAILVAPKVLLNGRSLTEHASLNTLPEFRELMLANRSRIERQVAQEGMSWSRFALFLKRDDHTAPTV